MTTCKISVRIGVVSMLSLLWISASSTASRPRPLLLITVCNFHSVLRRSLVTQQTQGCGNSLARGIGFLAQMILCSFHARDMAWNAFEVYCVSPHSPWSAYESFVYYQHIRNNSHGMEANSFALGMEFCSYVFFYLKEVFSQQRTRLVVVYRLFMGRVSWASRSGIL